MLWFNKNVDTLPVRVLIESFRTRTTTTTRFSHRTTVSARKSASFWREKRDTVVISVPVHFSPAHRWLSWLSTGLRRKCCLCNYICKRLDSLVFSDKDDKPEVPSHNPSMLVILWDVNIVYVIESAAYGVLFTSCLCQKPERARNERVKVFDTNNE